MGAYIRRTALIASILFAAYLGVGTVLAATWAVFSGTAMLLAASVCIAVALLAATPRRSKEQRRKEPPLTGSEDKQTPVDDEPLAVIVGFILHPEDSIASAAGSVTDLRADAIEDRLRRELSLPDAPVTVYEAGDWTPPRVDCAPDIYQQPVLRKINTAAVARASKDAADASFIEAVMADGVFETLTLPSTGRIVLFRTLIGERRFLGALAGARPAPPPPAPAPPKPAARQDDTPCVCDICGDRITRSTMTPISPTRITAITDRGYVPARMPGTVRAMAPTAADLAVAWKMLVAVNDTDWGLCQSCLREVDGFA